MHTMSVRRRFDLDAVICWLSLSTIFISGIYVETGFGVLFLSYGVMFIAYLMMMARMRLSGFRKEYAVPFFVLVGGSYFGFAITGVEYGISIDRFILVTSRLSVLLFFILFFTNIYNLSGKSVIRLFQSYLRVALFFAQVGIAQQLVFVVLGFDFLAYLADGSKHYGSYLGISALSVEPAFYACALMPAGAYYVSEFVRRFRLSSSGVIVVGAILLSTSSLGYIGLFASAAITAVLGIKPKHLLVLIVTLPLILMGAYKVSQFDFFQLRMNDTLSVLRGGDLTLSAGMNISTYSNAVNTSMAFRAVQDNFGFGTGFGTYRVVFDRYINDYELPGYRDELPGRGSATSFFARTMAEVGVAAWFFLMLVVFWLWKGARNSVTSSISIAYWATFLIILIRMGEYFSNGVILVFLMAYWLYRESLRQENVSGKAPNVELQRNVGGTCA